MNEVLVQFQGFHPSAFTQNVIDGILYELQSIAPHGSSIRAMFKRKDRILTASLRIMSSAGSFFITAQGPHLREVSQRLQERTIRSLRRRSRRRA